MGLKCTKGFQGNDGNISDLEKTNRNDLYHYLWFSTWNSKMEHQVEVSHEIIFSEKIKS